MKEVALVFITIIMAACSSSPVSKKESFRAEEVSQGAILDLARNSYLRGCAEGGSRQGAVSFEKCVRQARAHQMEIEEILNKKIIQAE